MTWSEIKQRLCQWDSILLGLAATAGVGGAVLAGNFLAARAAATDSKLQARYAPRPIVVAARDVVAGERLDTTRLAARPVPGDFVPVDAVTVEQASTVMGATAAIDIRRGSPILTTALRTAREASRLSEVIQPGMRALTLAVDPINSLAGQLGVGDRIDLLYSHATRNASDLLPLLQHVQVLAAGDSLRELSTGEPFSTITLAVSPDDAARVVLAQQIGSLAVLLRQRGDAEPLRLKVRNSRSLQGVQTIRSRPAGGAGDAVEVWVGGSGSITPERHWMPISREPGPGTGVAP